MTLQPVRGTGNQSLAGSNALKTTVALAAAATTAIGLECLDAQARGEPSVFAQPTPEKLARLSCFALGSGLTVTAIKADHPAISVGALFGSVIAFFMGRQIDSAATAANRRGHQLQALINNMSFSEFENSYPASLNQTFAYPLLFDKLKQEALEKCKQEGLEQGLDFIFKRPVASREFIPKQHILPALTSIQEALQKGPIEQLKMIDQDHQKQLQQLDQMFAKRDQSQLPGYAERQQQNRITAKQHGERIKQQILTERRDNRQADKAATEAEQTKLKELEKQLSEEVKKYNYEGAQQKKKYAQAVTLAEQTRNDNIKKAKEQHVETLKKRFIGCLSQPKPQ